MQEEKEVGTQNRTLRDTSSEASRFTHRLSVSVDSKRLKTTTNRLKTIAKALKMITKGDKTTKKSLKETLETK